MEWKDLSTTSANVLERCWGLYDDNPRSVHISIGETFKVWDKEYIFKEENYKEIKKRLLSVDQETKLLQLALDSSGHG